MSVVLLLKNTIKILTILYLFISYLFTFLCIAASRLIGIKNPPSRYTGGISILIPCFNEVLTIDKTLQSILQCRHDFEIEIIVIDDGYDCSTCDYLRSKFSFKAEQITTCSGLATNTVRSVESATIQGIPCYLINKDNGRKADALNAGINLAHYDYFLSLDGDSLLEKSALMELHRAVGAETLAIGGRVLPLLPRSLNLRENFYTIAQFYEYARTFSITRVAYSAIDSVPLLSGAISLFHTDTVRRLGGYYIYTKGEDFELTLRLQEYAQKHGGSVQYIPSAIVYTQVPFDLRSVTRQRTRWQQGMLEVFALHKKLFRKPNKIALVLHHMRLYEEYGCVVELFFLFTMARRFTPFIGSFLLLEILFTIYASMKSEKNPPISLFVLCIFSILFHYMNTLIKLSCFFRKDKPDWGSPARKEIVL